jgi:hypothetical protein
MTWWVFHSAIPLWRKDPKAWKGEEASLRKTTGKKTNLIIAYHQTARSRKQMQM